MVADVAGVRPEAGPKPLAPHLLPIGGGWAFWRTALLRSAGFPEREVLRLADERLAAAADALSEGAGGPRLTPEYLQEHRRASDRLSLELRAILASDRFREAVGWQNHHLLPRLEVIERPGARSRRRRRAEQKVAIYWQRFTVKNDLVGWFGPCGWARLGGGVALAVRPGPALLATRRAGLECWAVDAVAATLAADPAIKPWLRPRLPPNLYLDGDLLHRPFAPALQLTAADAALLRLCDGVRTAKEVALAARRAGRCFTEAEGRQLLTLLEARGLIRWTLEVPLRIWPEEALRAELEAVADPGVRARALAVLDQLESARDATAAASGREVGTALEHLDESFVRLTGRRPTHSAGQAYAGRTLAHLECCRDVDVAVGDALVQALAAPLRLVLASSRWAASELAAAHRAAFAAAYRRMGGGAPDLSRFDFMSLLDESAARAEALAAEAARRWQRLLSLPATATRFTASARELRDGVLEAFPAGGAAWPLGRYHSPDLMVDAESPEAVRAGRYQLVLGELHPAVNSILASVQIRQHSRPDDVAAQLQADLGRPTVLNVIPRGWPRITGRTVPWFGSGPHLRLCAHPEPPESGQELPISALLVVEEGGEVVARHRATGQTFDLAELFGLILADAALHRFRLLPPARHTPRVTIDRLVVSRESWCLPADELDFAAGRDEAARFAAARCWARRLGLPRFVFVRAPCELKPLFVDLFSPVLVEVLCWMLRGAMRAQPDMPCTFTEMLPGPDGAWLADSEGNRYASEIRIVALDLEAPA